METNESRTVLVTGATSGLGLEAAVLFAEQGYGQVIVTGRSLSRAAEAKNTLVKRTGKGVFIALALDLNDSDSVAQAGDELAEVGYTIDVLLLNAGGVSSNDLTLTAEGIEVMMASSLIGHHRLTMDLLARQLVSPSGRIVIAGSEAARGDVPTFTPVDLAKLAATSFDGSRAVAAQALITHDVPTKFKPANGYATAKLFVAWWAAALARQLPAGMTVNAVSPGSAPNTQAARNANFFMKRIMMPIMKSLPKFMGMAAPTSVAAQRYVDAASFGPDVSGQFFASAPKKMTGELHRVVLDHVVDQSSQEAAWQAVVATTNADVPAFA